MLILDIRCLFLNVVEGVDIACDDLGDLLEMSKPKLIKRSYNFSWIRTHVTFSYNFSNESVIELGGKRRNIRALMEVIVQFRIVAF